MMKNLAEKQSKLSLKN